MGNTSCGFYGLPKGLPQYRALRNEKLMIFSDYLIVSQYLNSKVASEKDFPRISCRKYVTSYTPPRPSGISEKKVST